MTISLPKSPKYSPAPSSERGRKFEESPAKKASREANNKKQSDEYWGEILKIITGLRAELVGSLNALGIDAGRSAKTISSLDTVISNFKLHFKL